MHLQRECSLQCVFVGYIGYNRVGTIKDSLEYLTCFGSRSIYLLAQ